MDPLRPSAPVGLFFALGCMDSLDSVDSVDSEDPEDSLAFLVSASLLGSLGLADFLDFVDFGADPLGFVDPEGSFDPFVDPEGFVPLKLFVPQGNFRAPRGPRAAPSTPWTRGPRELRPPSAA